MDPISNVDQIVLVLRQRLLERAKTASGGRSERKETAKGDARAQIHALAAVESIDDRQLKRALIQGILIEQLGEGLINEAKFQQIVDRVTDTIEADTQGSALLSGLVAELRAQAR